MLADPVIAHADAPADVLRREVLGNARKLFISTAHGAGPRKRGRAPLMNDEMQRRARSLYESGRAAEDIAAKLGVSRATLYRHLKVGG